MAKADDTCYETCFQCFIRPLSKKLLKKKSSSFSISGSNIDTTDGSTAGAVSAGTITSGVYNPGTITVIGLSGSAFSFSQSYTQGDAVPTSEIP